MDIVIWARVAVRVVLVAVVGALLKEVVVAGESEHYASKGLGRATARPHLGRSLIE
ncbi:MAG: hypothetical protein AAF699_17250 [Pseudomonadota bacterium]